MWQRDSGVKRRAQISLIAFAVGLASTVTPGIAGESGPRCFGAHATIIGTRDDDQLRGTEGVDVIVGRGGNDQIFGFGGDDLICGGRGIDNLNGDFDCDTSPGADRIRGGRGRDVVGGEGCGIPRGAGEGADVILGGRGGDNLVPAIGDDIVDGGTGRDTFVVGATEAATVDLGRGTTNGGEGNDVIARGSVEDIVVTNCNPLPHTLIGDHRRNFIYAEEGANIVRGRGGDDKLYSGNGYYHFQEPCDQDSDDRVSGGSGDDVIYTQGGDDVVEGGRGNDLMVGEDGDDHLVGGRGRLDAAHGKDGTDTCRAEARFECELRE